MSDAWLEQESLRSQTQPGQGWQGGMEGQCFQKGEGKDMYCEANDDDRK